MCSAGLHIQQVWAWNGDQFISDMGRKKYSENTLCLKTCSGIKNVCCNNLILRSKQKLSVNEKQNLEGPNKSYQWMKAQFSLARALSGSTFSKHYLQETLTCIIILIISNKWIFTEILFHFCQSPVILDDFSYQCLHLENNEFRKAIIILEFLLCCIFLFFK